MFTCATMSIHPKAWNAGGTSAEASAVAEEVAASVAASEAAGAKTEAAAVASRSGRVSRGRNFLEGRSACISWKRGG